MKKLLLITLLVIALFAGSGVVSGQDVSGRVQAATVINVVDGDTIDVLIQGVAGAVYRVRYIGINTPETDQSCGGQATLANIQLVADKGVVLVRDVSDTDQFGRLLRYVFVGGTFVNAALVVDGWAEAVDYPPDSSFAELFSVLEAQAFASNLGCWPSGVFGQSAVQTAPTATPTATLAAAGVTVTSPGTINLRGGPGTSYPITGTLSTGQTAKAEARNGDWLFLGGDRWVASWVVGVQGDVTSLSTRTAPPLPTVPSAPSVQPVQPAVPQQPAASSFVCDCSKSCGAMASCDEAYFQLQQCGCSKRDSDKDGVPCEEICPGG